MAVKILSALLSNPWIALSVILLVTTTILTLLMLKKDQNINILKNNVEALDKNLQKLDHQAKLIVKSDMELKLHQEEVEDKLNKLTLLKNLILSSIHILDKEDLFAQINETIINQLGFKKALMLGFEEVTAKVSIGCTSEEENIFINFLKHKKEALKSTNLLSSNLEICKTLTRSLNNEDFLIAPIVARDTTHAIFVIFSAHLGVEIKKAEEAIFSIICMYLGQCLDNIKLFEDLYLAKDNLEMKIKERTNELVKSLRDIERASRSKSDFISSVSHELRTPLTSVKGFSSLLVNEKFGVLPPEAKKRLEKIDINVDKLVGMVNMLLDIARIESGKTEVKIAPGDIGKLIHDVSDFLSPQAQSKNITLTTQAPESLLVRMDKGLIERVLINLISNAIKFTPQDGKITLECIKENQKATISISDTGCGIDSDDLEKVFQEFYRTKLTQGIQGTGLGLSLVKRIIDTHKEKVWVESEPGEGTTFNFTLKVENND